MPAGRAAMTAPMPSHLRRLVELLHNRVVRRVRSSYPEARTLVLIGDLHNGAAIIQPSALWTVDGAKIGSTSPDGGPTTVWGAMTADLRPEFGLLARICPVEPLSPYVLDLTELELTQLELPPRDQSPNSDAAPERPAR
jgi:hypothetical protein